jgi:hypothetical protein
MTSGVLSARSLNLTEVGRALKERIGIKHTEKRLQRNTAASEGIIEMANERSLIEAEREMCKDVYLYLDGGDITYSQAESYSNMSLVRDGSTGKLKEGYLNLVVYKYKNREVTPVFLDMYHRLEGYESDMRRVIRCWTRL